MKETAVKSEQIYEGKIVKLRRDEVKTEKGVTAYREIISHNGGSAVLVVKDGKILIEKQFRYAYGEIINEIPAGKREGNEDFAETAKRELEEETGLVAENIIKLTEIYPSPGYTNEKIGIFYVDKFRIGETHFDNDEDLTVEWIDADILYEMIKNGEIKDAKTLTAILMYIAAKEKGEL